MLSSKRFNPLLCVCACLLGALTGSTSAATTFLQTYQLDEHLLEKRGEYRYVYRMFFKLYDAALFTTSEAQPEDVLNAQVPFHLGFHYLRTIEKSIILESADKMLLRNLSPSERQAIADRVDQINAAYTTVNEGDTSSLSFTPRTGTRLNINGETVATIPGDDFAQLYFQIWLGEKPISDAMKVALFNQDK